MGKVGDFLNAWNERKAHLHAFDMNSEILDWQGGNSRCIYTPKAYTKVEPWRHILILD